MKTLQELKNEFNELSEHLSNYEYEQRNAKLNLKQCEFNLKLAKKTKNKYTLLKLNAKKKLRKMKQRISSYQSYVRSWNKKNMGKVMNTILEGEK
jgi:chromosome segregation ATPase